MVLKAGKGREVSQQVVELGMWARFRVKAVVPQESSSRQTALSGRFHEWGPVRCRVENDAQLQPSREGSVISPTAPFLGRRLNICVIEVTTARPC